MPLEPYQRGNVWWVKGTVEFDGRTITGYMRKSTGSSTEAGARDWIEEETKRRQQGHILGDQRPALTFQEAVLLYPAKPAEADRLLKLNTLDPDLFKKPVSELSPKYIRSLGKTLMPDCATDTWRREIVTPIKAVINNAHDDLLCPPIKVKGYTTAERVAQDSRRGKQSRVEKTPADRDWITKFVAHADPYNAALAEFMFETAARVGQAVALRPKDLDLMNQRVWLKASKGHPAQWVAISTAMTVRLANIKPKRPRPRKGDKKMIARVFGYAHPTSMHNRWRSICKAAGISYIAPHAAGRHAFYTELRVRQGLDPITAAAAGRWADASLPDRVYAHSDLNERELREVISTNSVQKRRKKIDN